MARKRKTKRNICDVHYDIDKLAQELEEILKELKSRKGARIARDISDLAEEARNYGQSMENRLSTYREAIEDMGFRRKKT